MRTQHFMSDFLCQQKLIERPLLLESFFNTRITRESTRDPSAKKASLMKFCQGYMKQHVFSYEVGVLPTVPPKDMTVSPLMPRTYTLHAFAPAPCVCTCVQGSPQVPPFPRPPATHSMSVCHQIHFPKGVGQPSCKRTVLKLRRPLLLPQETRWLDGRVFQALTLALRESWETWWPEADGNCFWRSLSLNIRRSKRFLTNR